MISNKAFPKFSTDNSPFFSSSCPSNLSLMVLSSIVLSNFTINSLNSSTSIVPLPSVSAMAIHCLAISADVSSETVPSSIELFNYLMSLFFLSLNFFFCALVSSFLGAGSSFASSVAASASSAAFWAASASCLSVSAFAAASSASLASLAANSSAS